MKLEDFLVGGNFVTQAAVDEAVRSVGTSGLAFGEYLLVNRHLDPRRMSDFLDAFVDFLAKNVDQVEHSVGFIDYTAARELGPKYLQEHLVFPLGKVLAGTRITQKVMIADKNDLETLGYLQRRLTLPTEPVPTKNFYPDLLEALIQRMESGKDEESSLRYGSPGRARDVAKSETEDARIVEFTDRILRNGVQSRASDIHLEIFKKESRVRYRIDGILAKENTVPLQDQPAIVSRLKILASLDIAERRMPQDGRFDLEVGNKKYDVRLSVVPVQHGEKAVMRLLSIEYLKDKRLDKMGLSRKVLQQYREAIYSPYGLVLITGPTGSGKSTTLYTSLLELYARDPHQNIQTIEDPIEYEIEGFNQASVDYKIGRTFPYMLRAFLRQDPDIILVGEIRDRETAEQAIQAALTGHLVLSTIHANSAPEAVDRLLSMEIEDFLISSALKGVMGQRLVRRICRECKVEAEVPDPEQFVALGLDPLAYYGKGCHACIEGYKGRIGLYEFLPIPKATVEEIRTPAGMDALKQRGKYVPMRQIGLVMVSKGITTLSEVDANTMRV